MLSGPQIVIGALIADSVDQIVYVAAGVAAVYFVVTKILLPGSKLLISLEKAIPFLKLLPILEDIAAQFRSDSGSTLKDSTNRLEASIEASNKMAKDFAATNRSAIDALQIAMGVMQELAKEDRSLAREDRQQLLAMLQSQSRQEAVGVRQEASSARQEASDERSEAATAVVASDLKQAQESAAVAQDSQDPGAAADAAALPPDSP